MRAFALVNNWLGWQCLRSLRGAGTEIVGMAVHPAAKRTFGAEILAAADLPMAHVFDGSRLREPEEIERIRELRPDIGVSILFDYILKPELLGIFPREVVNLHPSYLPYNRGQYPNVWSIVDGTPAGVSLHYVDEGVDTGDIIARREVAVLPTDTGESLYRRLEREALSLFEATWPSIADGTAGRLSQPADAGTAHRRKDVERIDEIDLTATYTAGELLDVLRARTFPPHRGAYFLHEGERVHVRIQLLTDAEIEGGTSDS